MEYYLQGIMVAVFIKTIIQSKIMNATTMIPCRHVSKKKVKINPREEGLKYKKDGGAGSETLNRTPKSYQDPALSACLNFFHPVNPENVR